MKNYVKNFKEFLNESKKTIGELKANELWNTAGKDANKYKEILKDYLQGIDVEGFMKFYTSELEEKLVEAFEDTYEWEEPYKDEDGDVTGGTYSNGLDDFDMDMDDDEDFGKYGISIFWCKNTDEYTKRNFDVYAFCGELDITESELGQVMYEVFKKMLDVCDGMARDNFNMSVQDAKDIEDTYRSIAHSNGWSY